MSVKVSTHRRNKQVSICEEIKFNINIDYNGQDMGWMFAAGSLVYVLEIKDGLWCANDMRDRLNWLQSDQSTS